eukprot:9211394-Karenia_brevis.AAC.1
MVESTESDGRRRAALFNEVRLLRRLRHPNIVLFNGVIAQYQDQLNDSLLLVEMGIVLELVEGGDFGEYCRKRRHNHPYAACALANKEAQLE